MAATTRLLSAGHSDVGRKRSENEDRAFVDPARGIYLIVDGLGGHAAGERAATIAVEIITARLARRTGSTAQRIKEAFALASTEIFETALRSAELTGMACVATLAVVEEGRVTLGHAGDSRAYKLEAGKITKLTHDHSPVGEMEDSGDLSEEAAMRHPRRNEVYRDLGSEPHAPDDPDFVEILTVDFSPWSALLLCSDGLTDQVSAEEIRSIVEQHGGEPDRAVRALIAAANDAGGKDNVSAILVEGAEFARSVSSSSPASERGGAPAWTWFLAGMLTATALLLIFKPYLETTAHGTMLHFGKVRSPQNFVVGPGGFHTISAALDAAAEGDTIAVSPGDYHENLHLRSGVSIVSKEPYGARVNGSGIVVSGQDIRNARFSGFDVRGPADVGIRIASSGLEVTSVRVSGMKRAGIEIEGDGQPIVQASLIEENPGTGILCRGGSEASINNNVVRNNGHGEELFPGIYLAGSGALHIFGNVITNSGAEQVWISPFIRQEGLAEANVIGSDSRVRERQIKVVSR